MKYIATIFPVLALSSVLALAEAVPGKPAPDFTAVTSDGKPFKLSTILGKRPSQPRSQHTASRTQQALAGMTREWGQGNSEDRTCHSNFKRLEEMNNQNTICDS